MTDSIAPSLAELHAEAPPGRDTGYGAGALVACDRLVRIYQAEGKSMLVNILAGLYLTAEQNVDLPMKLAGKEGPPDATGDGGDGRPSGTPSSTPCLTGRDGSSSRAT